MTIPPVEAITAALLGPVVEAAEAAALRQGGLAQLFADLSQALDSAALPAPVRQAAAALLALQTPAEPPPSAADLRQAFVQSGLLLEASLLVEAGQTTPDLKAALLVLTRALKAWTATAPPSETPTPAPPVAPPPPYRGGPTSAQPPAMPRLPADAPAATVAQRLLQQAGGALARQQLSQIASLPDPAKGPSWTFEVPIQTPQGTAVAQFQVSRDRRDGGQPGAEEDAEPTWRAGFSINLEPIGPVHAQAVLTGGRVGVVLWAEREEGAAELRGRQPLLTAALEGAGLKSDVMVHAGAPRRPSPSPGRLVDQAT